MKKYAKELTKVNPNSLQFTVITNIETENDTHTKIAVEKKKTNIYVQRPRIFHTSITNILSSPMYQISRSIESNFKL